MAVLRGWRFVGFVSCIVGAVGLTLYPVIVDPMINTEKYKTLQEYSKIKRDELQHIKAK
ncbi:uncharacterized protein [Drosophila kikkawai]|uniref:Small integral membrane protein 20 n=1 Tax=Drosophila kikkawai TaxID=30033 RepID=A0A6P4I1C4_DROKI|nr:uncharacterized protein LOC108070475 [Drosophila kikkawai]KAH8300763.1 hypothetical protein KR059_002833 [Drosophila kikkawai]KAH8316843.1 hypothetical protein KR059_011161 [Drosophila kikkawai]